MLKGTDSKPRAAICGNGQHLLMLAADFQLGLKSILFMDVMKEDVQGVDVTEDEAAERRRSR